MKVWIINTDSVSEDLCEKIKDLLRNEDTSLDFWWCKCESKYSLEHGVALPFETFFNCCEDFRVECEGIEPEDFVVLLAKEPNEQNWFSRFERRNIFVHTADWELFTKAEPQYAIAHQIVENIFQSLLRIQLEPLQREIQFQREMQSR